MKKTISLLLALVLCLSLCACGGSNTDTPETTEVTTAPTEAEPIVYQIGDTVNTDIAELVLIGVSYADRYSICVPKDGYSFIVIDYSLKNIGKTNFGFFHTRDERDSKLPSQIVWVDYNDGYIFDAGDVEGKDGQSYHWSSFVEPANALISDLKPLSEAVTYQVAICVPNEVIENNDAPLLININLLNAAGETVTAIYSIR